LLGPTFVYIRVAFVYVACSFLGWFYISVFVTVHRAVDLPAAFGDHTAVARFASAGSQ